MTTSPKNPEAGSHPLYDQWCDVVKRFGDSVALREIATQRQWTFNELHAAVETRQIGSSPIAFPHGGVLEFLLDILASWRMGKVVCPLEAGQSPVSIPAPPPNCVHLKWTSATTGSARVVAFTAAQLSADADNIVATMGLRPEWPNLGLISLAHSYGFSNLVLPLLLHGIPLVFISAPLPEMIRKAAAGETALTLAAVPALWRAWHETNAIPPAVRLAISAGAPLPIGLERQIFNACGLKVHNFYGSTECGGIAYDDTHTPRTEDPFIGKPMRNVTVSTNAEGCLVVQSAAAGETYWPEPSEALRDGKFVTTDVAEIKNGAVYLHGRVSDQINVAARKVAPETIEHALLTHPQVRECLVLGIPSHNGERGEKIVVILVSNAKESELKQHLETRLPAWQVPREWWFVESLSPNARGKISRAEWRQLYLKRTTST